MLILLTEDEQAGLIKSFKSKASKLSKVEKSLNERLNRHVAETKENLARNSAFIAGADKEYGHDGEIEIDPGAVVSEGDDDGAYVQAWVWVTTKQAGLPSKDKDE